jgi:predicted acyltransferase
MSANPPDSYPLAAEPAPVSHTSTAGTKPEIPPRSRSIPPAEKGAAASAPPRLASLDLYRGFVMFLMAAELLHLPQVARSFPDVPAWQVVGRHTSHVEWVGCSLHDLIQPSFSLLVGAALPFSLAARRGRGQSFGRLFGHALWRAAFLVFLGVFLRSVGRVQTNWTFEDTLSQIGLGYPILFLLAFQRSRVQIGALAVILAAYWALWAVYPLPPAGFDWTTVGVPSDWPHHFAGFAQHWEKNWNLGTRFDQWFLNLFPRLKPFEFNGGGYLTLSFIPTLGTMILGLFAGTILKSNRSGWSKLGWLCGLGGGLLLAGAALHYTGACPVVKRIWTPSWTLFSGGWCFLILGAFHALVDMAPLKNLAWPLLVIGMNSIAMYCLVHLVDGFIADSIVVHFGSRWSEILGPSYVPMVKGAAVLFFLWLVLVWMYRRKLFLRI